MAHLEPLGLEDVVWIHAPGHTLGHTIYINTNGDFNTVLGGDALSLVRPSLSLEKNVTEASADPRVSARAALLLSLLRGSPRAFAAVAALWAGPAPPLGAAGAAFSAPTKGGCFSVAAADASHCAPAASVPQPCACLHACLR